MSINCDLLRDVQRSQAEVLCRRLLPGGKKEGGEWKLADVSGAPGNSLGIQLTGSKAGLWHDRATGEGGDLVKLICLKERVTWPQAVRQIEQTLGVNLRLSDGVSEGVSNYSHSSSSRSVGKGETKALSIKGLLPCSENDLWQLSRLRGIPIEGLRLAAERKLLWWYWYEPEGCACWLVTDDARRHAIIRRLDGGPFKGDKKSLCLKGTQANWPIGITQATGLPAIALCEGAPDFLAAFSLSYGSAVESLVAPVCMTGASCRIHDDALPPFRGKRVRIFGHADEPGQAAIARWAEQLRTVEAEVDGFFFAGSLKADGSPVKDLNDFILADHKSSGCPIEVISGAFDFAFERGTTK
jgi:hypothetical protein